MSPATGQWLRAWIMVLGLAAFLAAPRAAGQWVQVPSGTTADLWAIAADEGFRDGAERAQAVIVGDGGTILTAKDPVQWSPAVSGTTAGLKAVTFGGRRFVAVGDAGTILTSDDAVTWVQRASGTTATLRGVAYKEGLYLAVGDAGTVVTSPDGVTWTAGNAGVPGWLRPVAVLGDAFLLGGQNGVLLQSADGRNFVPIETRVTSALQSIAVATERARIVGDDGLLGGIGWESEGWSFTRRGTIPYRAIAYNFGRDEYWLQTIAGASGVLDETQEPGRRTFNGAFVGNTFARLAVGESGMIWRAQRPGWVEPGTGIDGPVVAFHGDTVELHARVQPGRSYQWYRDATPLPGETAATLTLDNVQPADAATYAIGQSTATTLDAYSFELVLRPLASFSPGAVEPIAGSPFEDYAQLLPLADGRMAWMDLSDSSGPTWTGPTTSVIAQPDGKFVIVRAGFGTAPSSVVRRNRDGTLDPAFAVDPTLLEPTSALLLLPDGRFLLFSATSSTLSWRRLLATGALDSSFGDQPRTAPLDFNVGAGWLIRPVLAARDASGRAVVAINLRAPSYSTRYSLVQRLQADGSPDETFNQQATRASRTVEQLVAAGDKILLVYRPDWYPDRDPLFIERLNDNGTPDPTWKPLRFTPPDPLGPAYVGFALLPDGSVVTATAARSDISPVAFRLQRVAPNGQLDPGFDATFVGGPNDAWGQTPSVTIAALSDGSFAIDGLFRSLNGVRPTYDGGPLRVRVDSTAGGGRLVNVSARSLVPRDEAPLILGFSVAAPAGPKALLVRGVGQALTSFGVPGALPDPRLTLFRGSTLLLSNDNAPAGGADDLAGITAQVQAFPLAADTRDAAAAVSVATGQYTLHLSGQGRSGVALGELYDADSTPTSDAFARLVNLSAQGQVAPGEPLIAGFVVDGPNPVRVLLRAVGPGLAAHGVSGTLPDPILTLYRSRSLVATNDDWGTVGPNAAVAEEITAASTASGAFPLSPSSKDAALLFLLPPGVYTAHVTGAANTSGRVLVEVYEIRGM